MRDGSEKEITIYGTGLYIQELKQVELIDN